MSQHTFWHSQQYCAKIYLYLEHDKKIFICKGSFFSPVKTVFFNSFSQFPHNKYLKTIVLGTFWGNLLSLITQKTVRTDKGGGLSGRKMGRGARGKPSSGDPYGCHGNLPQPSAEAARLRYLQGNSRGTGREVFGVASPQRAQLPHRQRERVWKSDVDGCIGGKERKNGGNNAGGVETLQREREKKSRRHRVCEDRGRGARRGKEGRDEEERTLRRKSKEGSSIVIGRRQIT